MATINFTNGATATINMEELKTLLGLEGITTANVFDTIVINKPLETRKVDKIAGTDNREPVTYENMKARAKGITTTALKHCKPGTKAQIEYPKEFNKRGEYQPKGNGWIWLYTGEKVEGLSKSWKYRKSRKAYTYDLNPATK